MSTQAHRAVNKETSSFGREELQLFLVAARGDGARLMPPKGAAITTAP